MKMTYHSEHTAELSYMSKRQKKNDSSTPSRNQDKTNPEHKKLPKADNQQKSLTAIRIFKKSAA